ncbi:MAG: hypothetical protein HZA46_07750, partial [Planctomycetales bacterium]|nr:hypothetical protein [Planctomycetales bacterium]
SRDAIYDIIATLPRGRPIAVVLDSPGGDPGIAYQMASALRNHCGSFIVLVPRYAKSAATLFSLGAQKIIMGDRAELGPLDMQVFDSDSESRRSVLEYVQSLERLEAYTMRLMDDIMQLLIERTQKKVNTLLPSVIEFSTS